MGVDALLELSAARLPDKIAAVCGNERRTYRQLDQQANRLAHALIDAGLTRGERVGICLSNPLETVLWLFAVLKAGGVFFIVNSRAKADYLAALLADSDAWGLVATAETAATQRSLRLRDPARIALKRSAGLRTFTTADAPGATSTAPDKHHQDTDLAALVYTSGSTGRSKGVMLTHRNLLSAAAAICRYLENTEDDVILNTLPLSFTYGLGQVTTAFHAGATVVLERSMTYPAAFVDTIVRERITGLPLVPTLATLLLQQDLSSRRFPDLRYITSAAAALSTPKIQELGHAFPRARIYSMYGQTECQRASYLPPDQIGVRPTSVGIAIPGTEVWIVDEEGSPVPPGVSGELVIRGPHVMSGYWHQPEETARALRPGPLPNEVVLYTGDLFRMDRDGFLYFVDRKDDVIKTRGEKVAPRQVEEVIARLPGVAEVSVYGVPDEMLGEAIGASVTPAPDAVLTAAMIKRHCLEYLEGFMVPQIVDIRAAMPTTMSGKVSRRMLRAMMVAPAPEEACG